MMNNILLPPLTEKQVSNITEALSNKQKQFMNSFTQQSKKSKWLEVLANKKGIVVNEDMTAEQLIDAVDDWVLLEILDAGLGNKGFYKCECGAGLRFQYIVHHHSENKTYKLGETCLGNYTHLSPQILKDIKKGFHTINLERDELLIKIENEDCVDLSMYEDVNIPEDIKVQIEHDMPLLDKQIGLLNQLLTEQKLKEKQKRLKEIEKKKKEAGLDKIYSKKPSSFTPEFAEERFFSDDDPDVDVPIFESMTDGSLEALINQSRLEQPPCTTYYELMNRHLEDLKKIRKVEHLLSIRLLQDWRAIEVIASSARNGNQFSYDDFKGKFERIKAHLSIK